MASRHEVLSVKMKDGSTVEVRVQLAKPGAQLTERDQAAIRECIEQISARRMDPQRADRVRRQRRDHKPCFEFEADDAGLCIRCGEPRSGDHS